MRPSSNVGSAEWVATGLLDRVAVRIELSESWRSAGLELRMGEVPDPEAPGLGTPVPNRPVLQVHFQFLEMLSRVVVPCVSSQLE
jgi:hypothetical protein